MSRSPSIMGAALALICLAHAAGAQASAGRAQPSAEPIPRDVVMAILRNAEGAGEPSISVTDKLPTVLEQSVALPPGARVVAVLTDWRTRVIGTVTGRPDSIRLWFNNEFERRGYAPLEVANSTEAFRPAERSASGFNQGYCNDGALYRVSAGSRPANQVEFVLTVQSPAQCGPSARGPGMSGRTSASYSSGSAPPSLPLLFHPPGAETAFQCLARSGSGGSQSVEASISTSAAAEELLSHYARQLATAGWARQPFGGAVGTWSRRDSTGNNVLVTLAIEAGAGGPDCRQLKLTSRDSGE